VYIKPPLFKIFLSIAFSKKQISNGKLQNLMEVRIDGLVYQRVSDSNLGDLFVPGQANPGKNYFLQKIN